tara:strand:- start:65 stop:229 length:165 start_codon:yes stop_codon:yes gene_type:complete
MSYTVTSDIFEARKMGESITEKELLELELDIEALIESGHIKAGQISKPAIKEGA